VLVIVGICRLLPEHVSVVIGTCVNYYRSIFRLLPEHVLVFFLPEHVSDFLPEHVQVIAGRCVGYYWNISPIEGVHHKLVTNHFYTLS
jgi:hypothetical protein